MLRMIETRALANTMTQHLRFFAAIALACSCCAAQAADAKLAPACLISATSMGPIHLGMSLHQAKQAFPGAHFERSSDGDGAALVAVKVSKEELLILSAGEENSDAPIDWRKKINYIETFNPLCQTADGVAPGVLVKTVEKIFGKVKQITQSEIESREYIEFSKQPSYLGFRLDYTGIFANDAHRTRRFAPDGKIFSVTIASESAPPATP
ncbi:hypothetical protein AAKU55_005075 [Oxalobacteraceae bacterium GrIS 1.11]